jgi:hypothetical protein
MKPETTCNHGRLTIEVPLDYQIAVGDELVIAVDKSTLERKCEVSAIETCGDVKLVTLKVLT